MNLGETKIEIEEKIVLDPKWGEEDFSRMKDFCVSCGVPLKPSKRRFVSLGNYCMECSADCGENINHKIITIKPTEN